MNKTAIAKQLLKIATELLARGDAAFEKYESAVLDHVLKMQISDDHKQDLINDEDGDWAAMIQNSFKKGINSGPVAQLMFWMDQESLFGQEDEDAAEQHALKRMSELQRKYWKGEAAI